MRAGLAGPGLAGPAHRPLVAIYLAPPGEVLAVAADVEPGGYELRYLTGKGAVLARRAITVRPAPVDPGKLRVTLGDGALVGKNSAVEIILDASGSMLQRQGRQGVRRRIEIARETLLALLAATPSTFPIE